MNYRKLGKSGILVSEIALGCAAFHGLTQDETDAFLDYAIGNGINCMDMYTPDPDIHARIGAYLRGRREKLVVQAHFCTAWRDGQYVVVRGLDDVRKSFELMLDNSHLGFVDVGMIHYVDSMETWRQLIDNGVVDYALRCREEGLIRAFGISSHNPDVARQLVHQGVEILMFSINPCYDLMPSSVDIYAMAERSSYEGSALCLDPSRQGLYEECLQLGVGITVMKTFAGGSLLDVRKSPVDRTLTPVQCIHYALTRPAVSCIMAGARSREELDACLAYETAAEADRDYAVAFADFPRIDWSGRCLYCGHCAPCPKHIDVAMVTKLLNLTIAQNGAAETERGHYAALDAHAGDCIGCGACEKRCPFSVPVMKNMRLAAQTFGL